MVNLAESPEMTEKMREMRARMIRHFEECERLDIRVESGRAVPKGIEDKERINADYWYHSFYRAGRRTTNTSRS